MSKKRQTADQNSRGCLTDHAWSSRYPSNRNPSSASSQSVKRVSCAAALVSSDGVQSTSPSIARLINDIVIGEETDVDPDGAYISHLDLYLRAMANVGASTRQFDTFRSLARVGTSVEAAMVRTGVPPHVQAFVAHTMALAQSGSTEEVLAAFFYGREDIIPEMFSRL